MNQFILHHMFFGGRTLDCTGEVVDLDLLLQGCMVGEQLFDAVDTEVGGSASSLVGMAVAPDQYRVDWPALCVSWW